jgi:hypothetical protein
MRFHSGCGAPSNARGQPCSCHSESNRCISIAISRRFFVRMTQQATKRSKRASAIRYCRHCNANRLPSADCILTTLQTGEIWISPKVGDGSTSPNLYELRCPTRSSDPRKIAPSIPRHPARLKNHRIFQGFDAALCCGYHTQVLVGRDSTSACPSKQATRVVQPTTEPQFAPLR